MTVRALRRGSIAASRVQAPATVNVLDLPGASGEYASTPDAAANSVTGDIDIRVKAAADAWVPASGQNLVSKWNDTTQRSYRFNVSSTGDLQLTVTSNGSTLLSGSGTPTGLVNGQPAWLRVTRVSATGTCEFFQSANGTTWTSLGTAATTAGGIWDGTAPLRVGISSAGTTSPFAGLIYYAEVRNGIGGTVAAKYDPSTVTVLGTRNPTTLVASTGETWTMNGTAWDWAQAAP